jgi:DNA-binding PadR family transcriptional regulator
MTDLKISDNGRKVIAFLQAHEGNYTGTQIAEALGYDNQNKILGAITPLVKAGLVGKDKDTQDREVVKEVTSYTITEAGMNYVREADEKPLTDGCFDALNAVKEAGDSVFGVEIADALNKAPKSVYPLLNTLVKRGFVASNKVEITEVVAKEVTVYAISETGRELVLE